MKKPPNKAVANPSQDPLVPSAPLVPSLVVARVASQPIHESGIHYQPGQRLTLTPERAAALGSLINIEQQ